MKPRTILPGLGNNGFSLIEILVAAGLLSGLALGFASFAVSQQRALQSLQAKQDSVDLRSFLLQTIGQTDVCAHNVGAQTIDASVTTTDTSFSKTVMNFNQIYAGALAGAPIAAKKGQVLSSTSPGYTISKITLKNIYELDSTKERFRGQFVLEIDSPSGVTPIKPITVGVVLNTDATPPLDKLKVTSCGSEESSSSSGDVGQWCGIGSFTCQRVLGAGSSNCLTTAPITAIAKCQGDFPKSLNAKSGCPADYTLIKTGTDTTENSVKGTSWGGQNGSITTTVTTVGRVSCVKTK